MVAQSKAEHPQLSGRATIIVVAERRAVACWRAERAVSRVPDSDAALEAEELADLVVSVPRPETVTTFDQLIPRVVCQMFRNNIPVTVTMMMACFDPEDNKNFMAKALSPDQMTKFTFNEATFKIMSILTKRV